MQTDENRGVIVVEGHYEEMFEHDQSKIDGGSGLSSRKLSRDPLYRQVYEQLIGHMVEEGLVPGDTLPTEKELMEMFQVSRSTVREALRFLQAIGVVKIRQRQGAVLSQADISDLMSHLAFGLQFARDPQEDLWEARLALETGALPLVIVRASDEDFTELDKLIDKMEKSVSFPVLYSRLDMMFHRKLVSMTGNKIVTEFANVIERFFLHPSNQVSVSETERRLFTEEHRQIRLFIEEGDVSQAQSVLQRHLWRYIEIDRDKS